MLLYSAESSPLDRSKSFTLFLPWQTCSFRHQLGFSGKHSSHAAIVQRQFTYTSCPPLSIARYSFIQLSRLRRREENENILQLELRNGSKGDSTTGFHDCESGILPLIWIFLTNHALLIYVAYFNIVECVLYVFQLLTRQWHKFARANRQTYETV